MLRFFLRPMLSSDTLQNAWKKLHMLTVVTKPFSSDNVTKLYVYRNLYTKCIVELRKWTGNR